MDERRSEKAGWVQFSPPIHTTPSTFGGIPVQVSSTRTATLNFE
jgi:hypothetical protein